MRLVENLHKHFWKMTSNNGECTSKYWQWLYIKIEYPIIDKSCTIINEAIFLVKININYTHLVKNKGIYTVNFMIYMYKRKKHQIQETHKDYNLITKKIYLHIFHTYMTQGMFHYCLLYHLWQSVKNLLIQHFQC